VVKVYAGEYTLVDLAEIGANPHYRTAVTPWTGDGIGLKRYVGRAVALKGKRCKGAAKMSEAEIAKRLGIPEGHGWARAVKKIASTAADPETKVPGVALGTIHHPKKGSRRMLLPYRCFKIAEKHLGKDKVEIERGPLAHAREVIKPAPYPEIIAPIPV